MQTISEAGATRISLDTEWAIPAAGNAPADVVQLAWGRDAVAVVLLHRLAVGSDDSCPVRAFFTSSAHTFYVLHKTVDEKRLKNKLGADAGMDIVCFQSGYNVALSRAQQVCTNTLLPAPLLNTM